MPTWCGTHRDLYFLRLTAVFILRPGTEVPEEENIFFPFDPTVNAAEDWPKAKAAEPEGCAEAAGVPGVAPNVNTPDGLLFAKLKLVVVLLLPNWKTEEPAAVKAETLH